ncbi:MAG: ferrous iron transporter B [Erysipelotrichaceae bacterium]
MKYKEIVFVGCPNVGKSTLINRLANTNLAVGNYPGVSVDISEAFINNFHLIDLPGINDLDHPSNEELITKSFLNNKIDLIVNVLDSTNLKKNLKLTLSLRKLNIPMLIIFNLYDIALKQKININIKSLELLLNSKIICCSYKINNNKQIIDAFNFNPINYNYLTIDQLLSCIDDPYLRNNISIKLDKVFLNKYLGILIMLSVIGLLLFTVFIGSKPMIIIIDYFFGIINNYIYQLKWLPSILTDMLSNGIVLSLGAILSFIPMLFILYFDLALLEESGYLSRIAFLSDGLMRKVCLCGRSFVCLMMGFGCNVPAIYALRTLDNHLQRRLTAILIPFMSCAARLPVYMLFSLAFFEDQAIEAIILLYLIGIVVALLLAMLLHHYIKDDKIYVEELVPYHIPNIKIVMKKANQQVKAYIKKATGIIMLTMIIMWGIAYLPDGSDENSYLRKAAEASSFIFEPLGFGECEACILALPTSIIAKENVIGVIKQNIGTKEIKSLWEDDLAKLRAFCYMCFISLSMPCIMTMQALYKEYGLKILMLSILSMVVIPYVVTLIIFNIGKLIITI